MRDSNGYITKNLSGRKKQSPVTRQVKCEISFPHELQRVTNIMANHSLILDHETKVSVSLMVRRALILLQKHQSTLVKPLDIESERMIYRWIAKTGNESKNG